MTIRRLAAAILLLLGSLLASPGAWAQGWGHQGGGRWEQLGCTDIAFRSDHDVIRVGQQQGRFRAIMVEVHGNAVRIENLRVIYANGQPDNLNVQSQLAPGTRSRPLDLQGRDRAIARIEVVAQSAPQGQRQARLCVAGLVDEGPHGNPNAGRWQQLGCQQVAFHVDRDVIRVGRYEGEFRAIRLEVAGNDVHVENLTVVYGNGERDSIPVRAFLRAGSMTQPLDLRGNRRVIERIELVYQSRPGYQGQARVCASGLH